MRLAILGSIFLSCISCSYDKVELVPDRGYPEPIEKILVAKCATDGCHNSISRFSAAGLDFSTWDLMFEGGRNGTSVIPYSADNSFLMYSINTNPNRGPVLLPTMPFLGTPLSDAEYETLAEWIRNGAPDNRGHVKFSDNPARKKVYICMQGCDKVAVIDAETKIIMRYISVGSNPNLIESPHLIRLSPDGNFWYVVFFSGSVVQKFRTSDDSLVATLDIGSADWNTIVISPDGQKGFVSGTQAGLVKVINLNAMTLETTLAFEFPHGGFVTPDNHFLYLTSQNGNFVHKIDLTSAPFYDNTWKIVLAPGQQPSTASSLDPHEIIFTPDASKYFVTCQSSGDVRVMQLSNDSLLKIIPVGVLPQELDTSAAFPYIFVSCTEQPVSANQKGLVYVINYQTLDVVSTVYTGYQPHGLAVDDEEGLVFVANLNFDPNAPAPHHASSCGGRNGNLTIIDMNTLQLYRKSFSDGNSFQYKNELLVYPYFVAIRK